MGITAERGRIEGDFGEKLVESIFEALAAASFWWLFAVDGKGFEDWRTAFAG